MLLPGCIATGDGSNEVKQVGCSSQPSTARISIVDVENFGDPTCTRPTSWPYATRYTRCFTSLFATARIRGLEDCVTEDRGDGVLILIPPSVPKSWLSYRPCLLI